jgi:hypothetical protein
MPPQIIKALCPTRRVGHGPKHHFFGYYNKTNWDRTGRYLLANEVDMMDAPLRPELVATVGYFDLQDDMRFRVVGETRAWNWQMGCQLQWLDGLPGHQLIYNVRLDNHLRIYPGFGSVVFDAHSGRSRDLPLPVYVVAPNSKYALCVSYRRLYVTHRTIGYSENIPVPALDKYPGDDGIHYMDLASGDLKLIVSYKDLCNFHPRESMENAIHWVSHIEINPASSRVLFLHRWTERIEDETCFLHRLITMNPDGSDLRLLECSDHPLPQLQEHFDPAAVGTYDYEKSEYQISHPLWKNDNEIVVWGPHSGSIHYHVYSDHPEGNVEIIGAEVLTENGHMTFSPVDKRWLLSDTYPDSNTNERLLILYDAQDGIRYDVGSFYTDPDLKKENRCDLHPRWSRDGRLACIDSVHEAERQMYIVDLGSIVGRSPGTY